MHGEQEQHDTIKPALERERRLWRRLEAKLEALDSWLSHHMEEYAQRAAMEESFEARKQTYDANRQARSAGQLTKIATIIVLCTFVASIFSMGGSFAAGEDLFFV
jgi:Mg2+ and Co2+ transporter CorA